MGTFLKNSFLINLVKLNYKISYYVLIIVALFFFLISINFNIKSIFLYFKSLPKLFKKNKIVEANSQNELYEDIKENEAYIIEENRVHENLPFNSLQTKKENI